MSENVKKYYKRDFLDYENENVVFHSHIFDTS